MMRRVLFLPPLAMVASGCTPAEWTPSSTLEYAQPRLATVDLPARSDAMARWQLPPNNPWAPYAKYTLLSALDEKQDRATLPDVMSFSDVQRAYNAGRRLGEEGLPPGTLWVVDMRGASSVAFGVAVSTYSREPVSLVPTFNNWPGGESEVVPAEETLAAMVGHSPMLRPDGDSTTPPFFLLDSWRLAYRDEEPADDAYDNRYMLSTTDLPDAETLRARGINQVVYVVESLGQANVEEEDLHEAFLAYQDAGLLVSMVDIDFFEEPVLPDRWGFALRGCILHVRPRMTVIQQPWFYSRAHGGFGGVQARPAFGGGGAHGGGG